MFMWARPPLASAGRHCFHIASTLAFIFAFCTVIALTFHFAEFRIWITNAVANFHFPFNWYSKNSFSFHEFTVVRIVGNNNLWRIFDRQNTGWKMKEKEAVENYIKYETAFEFVAVYLNMPTRTIHLLESSQFASSGNTFLILFVFVAALIVYEMKIYSFSTKWNRIHLL